MLFIEHVGIAQHPDTAGLRYMVIAFGRHRCDRSNEDPAEYLAESHNDLLI